MVLGRLFQWPLRAVARQFKSKHSGAAMGGGQLRRVLLQFKDKTSVTVYDRQLKDTHFSWAPWVAGGQMLVFINFADFYWRYSMDQNEETGELTLASAWKRGAISGISLAAGLAIGGGILHFISRSVARMKIVDRGTAVVLETYRISGRGTKTRRFPIADMFSRDKLYTGIGEHGVTKAGAPQYSMRVKGDPYAFIMNRQGVFKDPQSLDTLFQRAAYVYSQ
ncbi:hypothetical protein IWW50_000578 [Coemansia erecta]|nr:hypothetical protein GGF43_001487 [Coemansia sp. RSA 2618]KAJ2829910.1 hypothetical protein IWW50_000578 [Coemansia erecta]